MKDESDNKLDQLMEDFRAQELDPEIRGQLGRVRAHAVSRARQTRPFFPLAPAAAFASAMALALAFGLQSRPVSEPPAVSSDIHETLFVYAPTDAEIAADLDFYQWLGSQRDAG